MRRDRLRAVCGSMQPRAVRRNLACSKYSLVQLRQRDSLPHSLSLSQSTTTKSLSMSWHDHTCGDINLRWCDGVPACDTCGSSASSVITDTIETPPPPPARESQKRSQLKLLWPPCVEYDSEPIVDKKGSNLTAFLIENIDRWENTSSGSFGTEDDGKPATESARQGPRDGNETNHSPVGVGINNALTRIDDRARASQTNHPKHGLETIYGHLPKPYGLRLLRLHGAESPHAPIHCSIEVTALDDPKASTYEALSYTWADLDGNKRNCMPIFIGPQYQVLLVTRNCHSALRSLRTRHDRVVWVDAICINQHNPLERQFQVGLMSQIYSSAARVLIYLGEERNASEKAMKLVAADPTSDEDGREALTQLHGRPYFHRIWVVQEIALARKASVTCGNETVHWTSLCSAFQSCGLNLNWMNHFSVPILTTQTRPTLLQLLINTRNSDCADQRDRVYGLVGLVHPDEAKLLPVDYSLTVQQVYTGLAAYWAQRPQDSPSFGFLSFAQSEKKISGLPSWVPDWSNLADRQGNAVGLGVSIDVTKIAIPQFSWGVDATEISSPRGFGHIYTNGSKQEPDQFHNLEIANYDPMIQPRTISEAANHMDTDIIKSPVIQSDVGSLDIQGYPLFRYSQGTLKFAGIRETSLQIDRSKFDGLSRLIDNEQELEIFYFPRWQKHLVLKKHAESIFSVAGNFSVNIFSPGIRPTPGFRMLEEVIHDITPHEASLILSWRASINFLQECLFLRSGYANPRIERSDVFKYSVNRTPLDIQTESPIISAHLELMEQMRTEMLQSLISSGVDNLLQLERPQSDQPFDSKRLTVRSGFKKSFCEGFPHWARFEGQPEDLVMSWRQYVTRLKEFVAQRSYAEALQNTGSLYSPEWHISGHLPSGSIFREGNMSIDGVDIFYDASFRLRKASLNRCLSWEWNRDSFWICLLSFDLIARLGEFLYNRRDLSLLQSSIRDGELQPITLI